MRTKHICGTVRSNRYNYPKDIINERIDKGDAVFYVNKDTLMVACKYHATKDKAGGQQKVVYMLSMCDQPSMVDVANRRHGNSVKPIAVKH